MDKTTLKKLKADAHALKPVVIVGAKELSDTVHQEIDLALDAHELIKIRINANDNEHRQQMINNICQQHQATFIQKIGHVITIYRLNLDK